MSSDKNIEKQDKTPEKIEKHGVVTEVVVPIVQSGVAGATGAAVANAISKPKKEKEK
jgi:hypothetical protein